jgi:uncharacterized membrane protein required for colicin V production
MVFSIIMLVVMLGVAAALHQEGLWTNFIHFVNFLIAALVATNFWEPLAEWLCKNYKGLEYFWDFLVFWGLLAGTFAVMRVITDSTSKFRVRFPKPVDMVGGGFFALWIGWLVVCVACMSLHMAPLQRVFLWQGFRPENKMVFGLAPDRLWLAFVQKSSLGAFGRIPSEDDPDRYVFDAKGEFLPMWASRREEYSLTQSLFGHDK